MSITPRFEKIEDYGPYDGFKEFTLAQAAFLWCGYKPPAQVIKPPPAPATPIKPFFPDNDYPPDVFAMNQELENTLNKYWRSMAGIVNGLKDEDVDRVEERLNYYYKQWGDLYIEFFLVISAAFKISAYDMVVAVHPIIWVNHEGLPEKKIRLRLPLKDYGITEFDYYDARARLFNGRNFSRKTLFDYARKRGGSAPLFLLSPEERQFKLANNIMPIKGRGRKELTSPMKAKVREKIAPTKFALPPGTRWADVAIKISHLKMTVDVRGQKYCTVDAKDIPAFYDTRKTGMVQSPLWNTFESWAVNQQVSGTAKKISRIRVALKECFAMKEDPLPHKQEKWTTAFILVKI